MLLFVATLGEFVNGFKQSSLSPSNIPTKTTRSAGNKWFVYFGGNYSLTITKSTNSSHTALMRARDVHGNIFDQVKKRKCGATGSAPWLCHICVPKSKSPTTYLRSLKYQSRRGDQERAKRSSLARSVAPTEQNCLHSAIGTIC